MDKVVSGTLGFIGVLLFIGGIIEQSAVMWVLGGGFFFAGYAAGNAIEKNNKL